MGLDVYVGTLTRYYRRDWLTIVQQRFPGVTIVRPPGADTGPIDPGFVRTAVADWQEGLRKGLGLDLMWSEADSLPYFTDKPAWDGYTALLLWAACEDQGLSPKSRRDPPQTSDWLSDPAFDFYRDDQARTRYEQILLSQMMWLPVPRPGVFDAPDPTGQDQRFGNCARLLEDLDTLNARTWRCDEQTRAFWHREHCEFGAPLEDAARAGWAMMRFLAAKAVEHQLPIVLDF